MKKGSFTATIGANMTWSMDFMHDGLINGKTFREEVLDSYSFKNLKAAQDFSRSWISVYNNERPHKSLGYKTPIKFLQERLQLNEFPSFLVDKNKSWEILNKNVTI